MSDDHNADTEVGFAEAADLLSERATFDGTVSLEGRQLPIRVREPKLGELEEIEAGLPNDAEEVDVAREMLNEYLLRPEIAAEDLGITRALALFAGMRQTWQQAEAFEGDEQVLIRASNGEEFEVPAPHGVAEIEQDLNDTVLELKIRPPSNDSVAIAVDGPDENGDVDAPAEGGAYECAACRALREDDRSAVDQCHDHRETPDSGGEPEGEGGETTEDHDDSPEDGDDGGVEAVDPRVSIITATTGGGNTGDGEITVASEASEIGLLTASDTLIARATFDSAVDLSGTVSVTLSVSNDDSVSRGVLTTDGQTAVRDTLADNSPTLPNEYAYGSDGTAVSESDTALGNELVSVSLSEILIQEADTQTEWENILPTIPDDRPLLVDATGPIPAQASFTTESDQLTRSGTALQQNDNFSDDEAERIEGSGDTLSLDFTLDYTIPEAEVGVWVRFTTALAFDGLLNGNGPELTLSLNGDSWTPVSSGAGFGSLEWRDLANDTFGASGTYDGGDLTPGSYTLTIEGTSSGAGQDIDVVAPLDNRRSFTFDNDTTASGERVSGPELFPNLVQPLQTATTRRDVTEATFDLTANDVSNNFFVELANDGSTFTRINNAQTGSVTFASGDRDVDTNIGFGRFGSDSTRTPTTGFNAQQIDDWELDANPDAVLRDDIGKTVTRGVVSPGTITGQTVREAGLKSGSVLLTRHELAEFSLLSDQRLASSETTTFTGDE